MASGGEELDEQRNGSSFRAILLNLKAHRRLGIPIDQAYDHDAPPAERVEQEGVLNEP